MALVTGCDAMQVRVELRDDTGAFSIAAAASDDVDYDEEYEDDDDDGIIAVFPFELRLIFWIFKATIELQLEFLKNFFSVLFCFSFWCFTVIICLLVGASDTQMKWLHQFWILPLITDFWHGTETSFNCSSSTDTHKSYICYYQWCQC